MPELVEIVNECFDDAQSAQSRYFDCQLRVKENDRLASYALMAIGVIQSIYSYNKANDALDERGAAENKILAVTQKNHDFWMQYVAGDSNSTCGTISSMYDDTLSTELTDETDYDVCTLQSDLQAEHDSMVSSYTGVYSCEDCDEEDDGHNVATMMNAMNRHNKTRDINRNAYRLEALAKISSHAKRMSRPASTLYAQVAQTKARDFTSSMNGLQSGMTVISGEIGRIFSYNKQEALDAAWRGVQ